MKKWFSYVAVFLVVLAIPTALLVQVVRKRPVISLPSSTVTQATTTRHTIFGLLTEGERIDTPTPTDVRIVSSLAGQVILRWSISESERVTGYRIYRDGEFLGIVSTTTFGDADTSIERTYIYSILALSASNQPSESVSVSVRTTGAVVTAPQPTVTPILNTNTSLSNQNTNTAPGTSLPAAPGTNTNTTTNTNIGTHVAQTVDMHVTTDHVNGDATISITAGDSVRFIYDGTGEVQIRISPSPGTASFTLDRERGSRTILFSTPGIFAFSSAEDDQDLAGSIIVVAL